MGSRDLSVGNRVRIDIPDETDPNHDRLHGLHGRIIAVIEDDAGEYTGDDSDSAIYRIEFETGETEDLRQRDLRPPLNDG